jgi:hypothetical protein
LLQPEFCSWHVPTLRETPVAPRAPAFVQPAALLEAEGEGVRAGVLLALEEGAALVLADGSELELLEGVSLCREQERQKEATRLERRSGRKPGGPVR